MKSTSRHFASLTIALAAGASEAGTVESARIFADSQMQVKEGAIQGCGYRLKAIPSTFGNSSSVVVLDTSFNFYSTGLSLLKGGALQFRIEGGTTGQRVNRPILSFWLKAQAEKPTVALNGKVLQAEDKGYLLYGVTAESVMGLFGAVWNKLPITIGMRIKGEPIDRIYSGTIEHTDGDGAQVRQCMDELVKQMKQEPEGRSGTPTR